MKLKVTLLLCLLALVMVTGCSDDDDNAVGHDSTLVGTWDKQTLLCGGVDEPFDSHVIVANADGSGLSTEDGVPSAITWSTSGNTLTITSSSYTETGIFVIVDNILTYTATYGDETCTGTFTKRVD